jgi:hypothetical protein
MLIFTISIVNIVYIIIKKFLERPTSGELAQFAKLRGPAKVWKSYFRLSAMDL